jgi:hypothetical protein
MNTAVPVDGIFDTGGRENKSDLGEEEKRCYT